MKSSAQLRAQLLDALAAAVDTHLSEIGFNRKKSALIYSRTFNAAQQEINFAADYWPKYQPGVEAHVHPMMLVRMPEVSEKALALVKGDNQLLARAPDIIINQPIDFTASKAAHQRWFATGSKEFVNVCESIVAFLETWVLQFLSEFSSPAQLVKLYETNDPRVMKQKHWFIFIAAAFAILDQHDKARHVVLDQFSAPGLRKRYAPLFESLAIR